MKFELCHLMPWPHLAANFRERHRSVRTDVPPRLDDTKRGRSLYHEYLDQLEYGDELGFDGIAVSEHPQNAYGLTPCPNLMAAPLARSTKRARIVALGGSVSLRNPATRLAEELAMIDVLSGGRLVAGFQAPSTVHGKHREGVELVLRAWDADQPFAFNGRHTQLRHVDIWPRPIQRPRPPVWILGEESAETWRWCLENDFLYAYLTYRGCESAARALDGFWATAEDLGVPHNPYRAAAVQFVALADSDAEAECLYSEHALYFYERCLPSADACAEELTWRDIVDRGYVLAGTAETVADQLTRAARRLNVGHLLVALQFGSLPHELAMENMRLFAGEVMPLLCGLFAEHEDRWWSREVPDLAVVT